MVASFEGRDKDQIVGTVGLRGFRLEALEGTYDHRLHHAHVQTGMPLPTTGVQKQVVFVSVKHDGEEVRFHVGSTGKVQIRSVSAAPLPPPAAGLGRSDGRGTFRKHEDAMFDISAEAKAQRRRLRQESGSVLADLGAPSRPAADGPPPGLTPPQTTTLPVSGSTKPEPKSKQQARYLDPSAPLLPLPLDAAGQKGGNPLPAAGPVHAHWSTLELPAGATWTCVVSHDAWGRPAGEQWYYLDDRKVPRYYRGPP